jgi:iron-sulfur cluster assembly protein
MRVDTLTVTLSPGEALLEPLLAAGAPLGHDCGGVLACASCAVSVREGAGHLSAPSEDELDMLERAGVQDAQARLACQATGAGEITVGFPRGQEAPVLDAASPVTLDAQAATHLRRQLAGAAGAAAVRLAVQPSGCSGHRYRLEIGEIRAADAVFESDGVRIAVDPLSLPFVQGTRIALVQEGLSRRLRFDNPNARQSCGCGESFGV